MITNIGINFAGGTGGGGGDSKVIGTKDFTVTANGQTNITMDQGVDGISAGTITTNVQPTLTAATFDQNGTYTPPSGVDGFSEVTVAIDGSENRLNKLLANQLTAVTQADLSGLTILTDYSFNGKSSIISLDLPPTVTRMEQNALAGTNIQSIDLANITYIAGSCFKNCVSLTSVTNFHATNNTFQVPDSCFDGCTALTGNFVIQAEYLEGIASNAFKNCRSLTSITITSTVKNLTKNSYEVPFVGCTGITFIDLTNSGCVPVLGNKNAFTAFTQNYEIRVPSAIYDAYTGATNWSDASIVSHIVPCASTLHNTTIAYKVSGGTKPTLYNLIGEVVDSTFDSETGYGVETVFGMTFTRLPMFSPNNYTNNNTLLEVEFGEGITKIGDQTLYGCSKLTKVVLPSTIQYLDVHWKQSGFNCNELTIKAITPPELNGNAFNGGGWSTSGTLYVPGESISAYQTWLTTERGATAISGWTVTAISE